MKELNSKQRLYAWLGIGFILTVITIIDIRAIPILTFWLGVAVSGV